jgi:hypothetical protein
VIQDVRTLHGSQFRDAALIVASPPCTEYSYMAMPWTRAKRIAAALRGEGEFPEALRETLSAIWYSPEAGGVRWTQSPAPPGGEPPHHALMGVRYDPAGADTLRFEDHERGVLAVIGRDAR